MKNKIIFRVIIITTIALLLGMTLSFISFSYINNYTEKEKLKKVSVQWLDKISESKSRDELIAILDSEKNSVLQISVFDSKYKLIYDANSEGLAVKNFDKFFDSVMRKGSAYKFDTPYEDKESMLMYSVKLHNPNLDEKGDIIVRFSDSIVYNNKPFWFAIVIGTLIWIFVVTGEYFIIQNSIKTIIKPLSDIENSLDKISKGDYSKERTNVRKRGVLDNMFEQINEISYKISDTMRDLNYEQQKSRSLLQFTNQGIIALSVNGTIMMKNSAVDKIFLLEEIQVGMAIDLLIEEKKIIDDIYQALSSKLYTINIYEYGEKIYRIETVNPTQSSGDVFGEICMLLVLTDISQEVKSAKIRSEFFANASHELKTPITAINGYSELLGMGNLSTQQQNKCVSEITNNVSKMKNLLNDMLSLSKLDAQIVQEEYNEVDMLELANRVVGEFDVIAKKKNISIDINGSGTMLAMPKMMETLLKNLVSNAIKYNKTNGNVWIDMKRDGKTFVLSVKDTGKGIPQNEQARLFERFYKSDTARTRTEEESTGLGLSIVKHIALLHNGVVSLESAVGEGSTFVVTFDN